LKNPIFCFLVAELGDRYIRPDAKVGLNLC
jgi:hypothetical protein